ncbi:hypothetical protein SAMD00019534_120330 [Acytostelium subglobosum LB1]|uniref:hypothetical protein n=1 Tax=Acytostelium subglobosum LB1 TaxID=1410327 RepID=UPI000644E936|nr:hypothetical protein SAMD00019534_120330 [Acytostelium subglobosum LB1]GAM28857.1 hypothetical protein SAMD00019534_120330 [Acytostelium subglobosum LB1]|eukprot:XP_012748229.1 hypothetical protein SAMD00019534_120330 [Acytostelium subglobosum LB1]
MFAKDAQALALLDLNIWNGLAHDHNFLTALNWVTALVPLLISELTIGADYAQLIAKQSTVKELQLLQAASFIVAQGAQFTTTVLTIDGTSSTIVTNAGLSATSLNLNGVITLNVGSTISSSNLIASANAQIQVNGSSIVTLSGSFNDNSTLIAKGISNTFTINAQCNFNNLAQLVLTGPSMSANANTKLYFADNSKIMFGPVGPSVSMQGGIYTFNNSAQLTVATGGKVGFLGGVLTTFYFYGASQMAMNGSSFRCQPSSLLHFGESSSVRMSGLSSMSLDPTSYLNFTASSVFAMNESSALNINTNIDLDNIARFTIDSSTVTMLPSSLLKVKGNASVEISGSASSLNIKSAAIATFSANSRLASSGAPLAIDGQVNFTDSSTFSVAGLASVSLTGTLKLVDSAQMTVDTSSFVYVKTGASVSFTDNAILKSKNGATISINETTSFTGGAQLSLESNSNVVLISSASSLSFSGNASLQQSGTGATLTVQTGASLALLDNSNVDLAAGASLDVEGGQATFGAGTSMRVHSASLRAGLGGKLSFANFSSLVMVQSTMVIDGQQVFDVSAKLDVNSTKVIITGNVTLDAASSFVDSELHILGRINISGVINIQNSLLNITKGARLDLNSQLRGRNLKLHIEGDFEANPDFGDFVCDECEVHVDNKGWVRFNMHTHANLTNTVVYNNANMYLMPLHMIIPRGNKIYNAGVLDYCTDILVTNNYSITNDTEPIVINTGRWLCRTEMTNVLYTPFNNTGSLEMSAGIIIFNRLTQTNGTIMMDGGVFHANHTVEIESGLLYGVGHIYASIENNGTIGTAHNVTSTDNLTISGDLYHNGEMVINVVTPTNYSVVNVQSNVVVGDDATLVLKMSSGLEPGTNASVMNYASIQGKFSSIRIKSFDPATGQEEDVDPCRYQTDQGKTSLSVLVSPQGSCSSSGGYKLPIGAIIGIVIGCVVVTAVIIGIASYRLRFRLMLRRSYSQRSSSHINLKTSKLGN